MKWYLFFLRVALIGNVFFVLFLFMKWYQSYLYLPLLEFIIALSALSVPVNAAVNLAGILLLMFRKDRLRPAALWLVTVNFIVLLIQVYHLSHIRISI